VCIPIKPEEATNPKILGDIWPGPIPMRTTPWVQEMDGFCQGICQIDVQVFRAWGYQGFVIKYFSERILLLL